MPVLLPSQRPLERLAALKRQAVLDIVADGAEAVEGRQKVRFVARTASISDMTVMADGRYARGWRLAVGIYDREVLRDGRVQRLEDL